MRIANLLGNILAGIFTAGGVVMAPIAVILDSRDIVVISGVLWLKWTYIVAWAFMLGAVWVIGKQQWLVKSLKDERPKPRLSLAPHPDGGLVRLRLDNNGGAAEFIVKGITDEDPDAFWNVRWRGENERTQNINKGDHELLEIAEAFTVGFADEDRPCIRFLTAISREGSHREVDDFILELPSDGFHLNIQVSAEPPMHPTPILQQRYLLARIDGRLGLTELVNET